METFTDEDKERFFLAENINKEKFFKENPDLRQDFLEWCKKNKK